MTDGSLLSESLYAALITATLLLSYRLVDAPRRVGGRWRWGPARLRGTHTRGVPVAADSSSCSSFPSAGFPRRWFARRVSTALDRRRVSRNRPGGSAVERSQLGRIRRAGPGVNGRWRGVGGRQLPTDLTGGKFHRVLGHPLRATAEGKENEAEIRRAMTEQGIPIRKSTWEGGCSSSGVVRMLRILRAVPDHLMIRGSLRNCAGREPSLSCCCLSP